jgi:hypothetical protein
VFKKLLISSLNGLPERISNRFTEKRKKGVGCCQQVGESCSDICLFILYCQIITYIIVQRTGIFYRSIISDQNRMKIPVDVAAILFYIIQPEYLFMVYKIFIDSSFGMIKQAYKYA